MPLVARFRFAFEHVAAVPKRARFLAIPSVLYTVNNVVYFACSSTWTSHSANLKILMTGLMSVMILGRRLTEMVGLCLLSAGAVLVQSAGAVANGSNLMGFCLIVLHSSLGVLRHFHGKASQD